MEGHWREGEFHLGAQLAVQVELHRRAVRHHAHGVEKPVVLPVEGSDSDTCPGGYVPGLQDLSVVAPAPSPDVCEEDVAGLGLVEDPQGAARAGSLPCLLYPVDVQCDWRGLGGLEALLDAQGAARPLSSGSCEAHQAVAWLGVDAALDSLEEGLGRLVPVGIDGFGGEVVLEEHLRRLRKGLSGEGKESEERQQPEEEVCLPGKGGAWKESTGIHCNLEIVGLWGGS